MPTTVDTIVVNANNTNGNSSEASTNSTSSSRSETIEKRLWHCKKVQQKQTQSRITASMKEQLEY